MSYILDALRKSEQERQAATGQSAGMLFPIEIQRHGKSWLPVAVIILVTLLTCLFIWWMWAQPLTPPVPVTDKKPDAVVNLMPASPASQVVRVPAQVIQPRVSETTQRRIQPPPTIEIQPSSRQDEVKSAVATPPSDPLKDMPPLLITGYVHDEQGGNIAMINNLLIHEGEEVSPGLRLIKILDDSAIFSYKGYIFSR